MKVAEMQQAASAALAEVLKRNPTALLIVYEAPHTNGHIQGYAAVPNSPSVAIGLAITGLNNIVPGESD